MGEVDAKILAKVVEYCKYHHLSDRTADEIERWEREFVAVDKSTLFQLILVSLDPSPVCSRNLPLGTASPSLRCLVCASSCLTVH